MRGRQGGSGVLSLFLSAGGFSRKTCGFVDVGSFHLVPLVGLWLGAYSVLAFAVCVSYIIEQIYNYLGSCLLCCLGWYGHFRAMFESACLMGLGSNAYSSDVIA